MRLLPTRFITFWLAFTVPHTGIGVSGAAETVEVTARSSIRVGERGPEGHGTVVTALAVHPSGKWLAAGGDDHIVRIFDTHSEKLLYELDTHEDWIRTAAFSPDGMTLATAGHDRQVILWDTDTWSVRKTLKRQPAAVSRIRYSSDGRYLATAGRTSLVRLYDLEDSSNVYVVECNFKNNSGLAFSPDGYFCASGCNGNLGVWDTATRRLIWEKQLAPSHVRALAVSNCGQRLATVGGNGRLHVWNLATGNKLSTVKCGLGKPLTAIFLDGDLLAIGKTTNEIHILNPRSGRHVARLTGHTGSAAVLAYDATTEQIFSAGFDTTLRRFHLSQLPQSASTSGP